MLHHGTKAHLNLVINFSRKLLPQNLIPHKIVFSERVSPLQFSASSTDLKAGAMSVLDGLSQFKNPWSLSVSPHLARSGQAAACKGEVGGWEDMGASLDYLARRPSVRPLVGWFVCGGGGRSAGSPGYTTTHPLHTQLCMLFTQRPIKWQISVQVICISHRSPFLPP